MKWTSSYWVKTISAFQATVTMTFDLLKTKLNMKGFLCRKRATILQSLNAVDEMKLKLLSGNHFPIQATVVLTFDLLTHKTIGFFFSLKAIILRSLKVVCEKDLKLLNGNKLWQTVWWTWQKQYVYPRERKILCSMKTNAFFGDSLGET